METMNTTQIEIPVINVGDEIEVTAEGLKPRRLIVTDRSDRYIITTSGRTWGGNMRGGAIDCVGFGDGATYQPTMMQPPRRLVSVRVLRTAEKRN